MTSYRGSRHRLPAPARREQLLDTAAQLAADDGFHALSVEAVAQRAGVTRAVIYQHFRDLDHLLETLLDREMSRAGIQVAMTAPGDLSSGEPRELLLNSLAAFLQAVRDNPRTWRLVLMPSEGAPPALRERIAQGRAAALRRLAAAMPPERQGCELQDSELTARVLSAIADEYARLVLTDPDRYLPERLLQHAKQWLASSIDAPQQGRTRTANSGDQARATRRSRIGDP